MITAVVFFTYSIDASAPYFLARYMNDEEKYYNVKPKVIFVDHLRIAFFAARNINEGEDLTYNYGPGPHDWRYILVSLIFTNYIGKDYCFC